ncbi:MAG: class I SAM-dependent methyltransferase [Bdellovibrionota bacterium]
MKKTLIDDAFFENYAGSGKAYSKVWRHYCYFDECCALFKQKDAPRLKNICVLGTASGEILQGFEKKLGIRPFGCEVSESAYKKTPAAYRRRVKCEDMRDYVANAVKAERRFSLVFSNSFIYLTEAEVLPFLKKLALCTEFLHFRSSFSRISCPDPWRRTLKPYAWWNERLEEAGFGAIRGLRGSRTYLWRSSRTLSF